MSGSAPRRPRALVLTYVYRPEPNFTTGDVADLLAESFEVTVIAPFPSYPVGRFYSGFRPWWPARRRENGVTVWRVPHFPDRSRSTLRRAISYLSFTLVAALFAPWVAGRPKLVWVYQTPFTTALAALWFKWRAKAKIVFTSADLWPESFTASGVAEPGLLMTMLFAYRRWMNRQAESIICSTQGTLEQYASEGIDRARLHLIPVWVEGIPSELPPTPIDESKTIVYAGNLGVAQALDTVVRAAALLEQGRVKVKFALYGTGSAAAELHSLANETGATNVSFPGRVTPSEAFRISSEAFAQIVTLRCTPLFRMTIPSKLFFCFAAGSPILAGLEGEGNELACRSGGAITFVPEDPHSLVEAVERLLALSRGERDMMRQRARAFYEASFRRERLLDAYRQVFEGVSPTPPVAVLPNPPQGFSGAARQAAR